MSSRGAPLEKCKSLSKIKNTFETRKVLNDDDDVVAKLETRNSIHAELELLKTSANSENTGNSTPNRQRKVVPGVDAEKVNLAASFLNQDRRERSKSFSMSKEAFDVGTISKDMNKDNN